MSTMTIVCSHADYEQRNPDERDYASAVEKTARARWLHAHDTLDEYTPLREFPCPGMLRVVSESRSLRIIECDVCNFVTSARTEPAA